MAQFAVAEINDAHIAARDQLHPAALPAQATHLEKIDDMEKIRRPGGGRDPLD